MPSDFQTVTVRATVSAINKKTFTHKRTINKRYKPDISSQAILKHTWMEETELPDRELISSLACIFGVNVDTIHVWFQNKRDSKINKFHFAMLCLILQDEHPRVTPGRIVLFVVEFLKECGDNCKTYIYTAVNDYISKKVVRVQQKDPCLSIGDCEGLVIYSFLWNVARILGTA